MRSRCFCVILFILLSQGYSEEDTWRGAGGVSWPQSSYLDSLQDSEIDSVMEQWKALLKRKGMGKKLPNKLRKGMGKKAGFLQAVQFSLIGNALERVPEPEGDGAWKPPGETAEWLGFLSEEDQRKLGALGETFDEEWELFLADETGSVTVPGWWWSDDGALRSFWFKQGFVKVNSPADLTLLDGDGLAKVREWISQPETRMSIAKRIVDADPGHLSVLTLVNRSLTPNYVAWYKDLVDAIHHVKRRKDIDRIKGRNDDKQDEGNLEGLQKPTPDKEAFLRANPVVKDALPLLILSARVTAYLKGQKKGLNQNVSDEFQDQVKRDLQSLEALIREESVLCELAATVCNKMLYFMAADSRDGDFWRNETLRWAFEAARSHKIVYLGRYLNSNDWRRSIEIYTLCRELEEKSVSDFSRLRSIVDSVVFRVEKQGVKPLSGPRFIEIGHVELPALEGVPKVRIIYQASLPSNYSDNEIERRFNDMIADIKGLDNQGAGRLMKALNNISYAGYSDVRVIPQIFQHFGDKIDRFAYNTIRYRVSKRVAEADRDLFLRTNVQLQARSNDAVSKD